MQFKGQEQRDGKIVLVAQHPPGCLAQLNKQIEQWAIRIATALLWFGLGLLVGLMW